MPLLHIYSYKVRSAFVSPDNVRTHTHTRQIAVPGHKSGRWNRHSNQQVCVQPPSSAVNLTLPAFDAERRAAATLLPARLQLVRGAGACSCLSISPTRRALGSKPTNPTAAAVDRCDRRTDRPTDTRHTDARPLQTPCSAYDAGSASKHEHSLQNEYCF